MTRVFRNRVRAAVGALALLSALTAPLLTVPTASAAPKHRHSTDQQLERNKAVVAWFYDAFNAGDTTALDRVLAPHWVDDPAAPGQAPGPEGFHPIVDAFHTAFADLRVVNEDVIAEGDRVAVRSTVYGTHVGDFFGLPATGRTVSFRAMDIHQVRGGRIIYTWHLEDIASLTQQLTAG